jgi:hypothetical protein
VQVDPQRAGHIYVNADRKSGGVTVEEPSLSNKFDVVGGKIIVIVRVGGSSTAAGFIAVDTMEFGNTLRCSIM